MPKTESAAKKYARNPRHKIIVMIGTGNQYCRNCDHYGQMQNMCGVFLENLKVNPRFGAERCSRCREAEHVIQEMKQEAQKLGEDAAFFRVNVGDSNSRKRL